MEDIFEEVVGAVDSGYDFDTIKTRRVSIESAGDDTHVVSGRAPISELNDSLKLNLPVGEAHTVAGFLINRLRHIPEVGDTVVEQGYRYTVIEADARTVTKVRVDQYAPCAAQARSALVQAVNAKDVLAVSGPSAR
jgi:putative hemolysin